MRSAARVRLMPAGTLRRVNAGRVEVGGGAMRAAAVRTARILGFRSMSMVVIG